MTRIEKLASIGSESLGGSLEEFAHPFEGSLLGEELFAMLKLKNGFYAFEFALHVFPVGSDVTGTMTSEDWNSETLWRSAYGLPANGQLFFAEDIFGDQFCVSKDQRAVSRFSAETGDLTGIAESLEGWADLILTNFEVETGWTLAHKWQEENGPLSLGQRLQPKIPFIFGGAYALENIWTGDAVEGMLFKADLASQVKDLPDGTRVRLRIR